MRDAASSFRREESGATAVEFALILLPLLVLVFGTIEFGRALWTREALESVASNSARCMGVLNTSCAPAHVYSASETIKYVQAEAQKLSVTLPASAIALNASASCAGIAGFSEVTITYRFQTVVPLAVTRLKDGIPLVVTACFPNQPTGA